MVHLGANLCAGTPVPLGVIAAGTGNGIARELGLPVRDAAASVQRILSGSLRQVDAARRTTATGEQVVPRGARHGLRRGGQQARQPADLAQGPMRYNLAILRELPVFRAIPYTLVLDGERIDTEAMLVAVGGGPAYGGGMRVTPDASFDDGLLDVLILRKISTFEFLRVFPRVFKGTHVSHHAVQIRRARTVSLEAKGIVSYADGERFAPLPMSMEVVSGALTVLA